MRQVLTLVCILGVMPLLTGLLFAAPGRRGGGSCAYTYLAGLLTILGAFQAMALPMGYLHTSLKRLCMVFLGACAVLCLAGVLLFVCRRKMIPPGSQGRSKGTRRFAPLMALVLVCILFQMVFVTEKQHIDEDDAYYLGTAVTAVEYDSLYTRNPYTGKNLKADPEARYMLASWPLFIAVLSKVSGIQAVKLAHMILPAVVLSGLLSAGRVAVSRKTRTCLALYAFCSHHEYLCRIFDLQCPGICNDPQLAGKSRAVRRRTAGAYLCMSACHGAGKVEQELVTSDGHDRRTDLLHDDRDDLFDDRHRMFCIVSFPSDPAVLVSDQQCRRVSAGSGLQCHLSGEEGVRSWEHFV